MTYKIIGFSNDASHVIFRVEDRYKFIKSTLPKADLIAYLDILPFKINTALRNEILNEARLGGRCEKAFSIDGEKWTQSRSTQKEAGSNYYKDIDKYSKYLNVEQWKLLPDGKTSEVDVLE